MRPCLPQPSAPLLAQRRVPRSTFRRCRRRAGILQFYAFPAFGYVGIVPHADGKKRDGGPVSTAWDSLACGALCDMGQVNVAMHRFMPPTQLESLLQVCVPLCTPPVTYECLSS